MTYLRELGEMLLRMSSKDGKKGDSFLDLSLDELFTGSGEKGIDGLLGEVAETQEQIIDHMVKGNAMSPEHVDNAIAECHDVGIYSLLLAIWLRSMKEIWAMQIEEGTAKGFCPTHKVKLELQTLMVAGSTNKSLEFVCNECLRSEILT